MGKVYIFGEDTPFAKVLVAHLGGHLVTPEQLPGVSLPHTLSALIVLLSPPQNNEDELLGRSAALLEAFKAVRTFAPTLRTSFAKLLTVSQIDGAFALNAPLPAPASSGALIGLAKTAAQEWPKVQCTSLDIAASLSSEEAAEAISRELHAPYSYPEIGVSAQGRCALQLRPEPLPVQPTTPPIDRGELVVISGGARGVTAECALAIAQTSGANLLLLGRSPLPSAEPQWLQAATTDAEVKRALLKNGFPNGRPTPRALGQACNKIFANREVTQTLQRLAEAGVSTLYRAVDVRDADALKAAIEEARTHFGPVRGLIHGAGVLRDRRIEDKTDEQFNLVTSTKVDGLRALLEATGTDPLRFIGIFCSVSGRFGRRGQVDYAMANACMSRFAEAEAARRPECRVVALDWGPWAGGMVTPGLRREFEREGIGMIPLRDGALHLAAELALKPSAPVEVVLGVSIGGDTLPPWKVDLDPATQPFLRDHSLNGKPVIPFALVIEWLSAAVEEATGEVPRLIEDARLLKGIVLEGPTTLYVRLEKLYSEDNNALRVQATLINAAERVHARARFSFEVPEHRADLVVMDIMSPYPFSMEETYKKHLFHGPSFHALTHLAFSGNGLSASLLAAPTPTHWLGAEAPSAWTLDPLTLDGCFQAVLLWSRAFMEGPSLPSRFQSLTLFSKTWPKGAVEMKGHIRSIAGALVTVDIDLFDAAGTRFARIDGHQSTASARLINAFQTSDTQ